MQKIRPRMCAALLLSSALAVLPAWGGEVDFRVTLLGTGSPIPLETRFSQSTLVEVGGHTLLFDAGRGATIRMAQAKVPIGSIDVHFLTHMHSDHVNGLPDLWLTGWLMAPFASRHSPMVIFGPEGTVSMTEHLTRAFEKDIAIRSADERIPPDGIAFQATDIQPGVVWSQDGVTVTAFEVNHGVLIKPAFGYKIEFDNRSVVISGDTKYDERIVAQARGADLLVHEVANIDLALADEFPRAREILDHHTNPEEAGRIFAQAKPKLAVYSHIVEFTREPAKDIDAEALVRRTRATYDGPLRVGNDLMAFEIGDEVAVIDRRSE